MANRKEYMREYQIRNKDRLREYQKEYNREYHIKNKDKISEKKLEYKLKNKDKIKEYLKEYHLKNKDKIKEYNKEYQSNRKKTDPIFKLAYSLRNRLNMAIKNNQKVGSAVKDLGCSIEELKQRLEAKFTDGMTWENHGTLWHVDHIIPLAAKGIDLTDPFCFKLVNHYSNLQPMFCNENQAKQNTLPPIEVLSAIWQEQRDTGTGIYNI